MRLVKLLLEATSLVTSVNAALDVDFDDPKSIAAGARTMADSIMAQYTGNLSGGVPGYLPNSGQIGGYFWWEGGGLFGGLLHYWKYSGDPTYNPQTTQALLFQAGDGRDYEPSNQSFDLGNDDQSFWAMASMTAAELAYENPPPDQPQWLELAQAVFNRQVPRWDPESCGGGMRWQIEPFNKGYDYKATIAETTFINIAARLAKYTGNSSYADKATEHWNWLKTSGLMDPHTYRISDGAHVEDNCTDVNAVAFSYCAGAALYGVAAMWNFTGDDGFWRTETTNLITSIKANFFPNGGDVLDETACQNNSCDTNNDVKSYKAYILRWIANCIQVAPWTRDQLFPLLQGSAKAAVKTCNGGDTGNMCGFSWIQGTFNGEPNIGQQMAVMDALQSLLVDNVAGPVNQTGGGTSKGNAGAATGSNPNGGDGSSTLGQGEGPTTADKAGASILTILVSALIFGTAAWLIM